MKKWEGYILNIQGLIFFQRKTTETNTFYHNTQLIEPKELYIERIKQKDNKYICVDIVTGITFIMFEQSDNIIIFPSGITINKNRLIKCQTAINKAAKIIDDENLDEKYTEASEDLLINTFYCKKIIKEKKVSYIPEWMLKNEINNKLIMKRKKY